jgi:hypothetical protein
VVVVDMRGRSGSGMMPGAGEGGKAALGGGLGVREGEMKVVSCPCRMDLGETKGDRLELG